ncbi:MAG: 2Fe-2S iron-sulfur cluster-binding protein [Kiritimatiellia bacterium]
MPQLKIDGKNVTVPGGTTILQAAKSLGIEVPTLCHLEGYDRFTSCMVCSVRDATSGRIVPACSAAARDGMVIETVGEEVQQARRSALELILGEHVGECDALCRLACPAHMDVPLMIRQVAAGDFRAAAAAAREALVLPATLGRICPGPCEKSCRRGRLDQPLGICMLHRFAADLDLSRKDPYLPACAPATGKKVAIIGAGPAGLAAAWSLALRGHACTVFDEEARAGGHLRSGWPADQLPPDVLDREVELIRSLGVGFRLNIPIGFYVGIARLKGEFNAIVLAVGNLDAGLAAVWGVASDGSGIAVEPGSFRTSDSRIFAVGEAVAHGHLVVKSIAQGKAAALAIDSFLGGRVAAPPPRFQSRVGAMEKSELEELMKLAERSARIEPAGGKSGGFTAGEARAEARRCMHCDCHRLEDCKLRRLAEEYGADQHRCRVQGRRRFERNITHPDIIFEPGKCIKCGICVRIAVRAGESPGLAFTGRGFGSEVAVPFGETLGAALKKSAAECVQNCPTGALASR